MEPRSASTITELPTEILRKILVTAWPRIDVQNSRAFVGRTANVCSWWRAIIIGTPELWCNFDISFPPSGVETFSASTNYLPESLNLLVDLCLYRSGQYPLSFRFHPKAFFASIPSIMTRLLKHSSRWLSASFSVVVIVGRSGLFPLPQPFDALEYLTLDECAGFTMLQRPPRLKSLQITSLMIPSPSDLNVPWHRLTDFSLTTFAPDTHGLFPLFRALGNVERLSLTLYSYKVDIPMPDHPPVSCSRLQSLELKMTLHTPPLRAVLGKLRTKNLTSMRIVPLPPPGPSMVSQHDEALPIVEFLEISEVELTRLELVDFYEVQSMMPILRSLSARTVKHLQLQAIPATFLENLRRNDSFDLLPHLESLTLSDVYKRPYDLTQVLVDVLCSRLPSYDRTDPNGDAVLLNDQFLKQVVIWDIYGVLSQVVSKLNQVLPRSSFSWDYRNFVDGKPMAVHLKFRSPATG